MRAALAAAAAIVRGRLRAERGTSLAVFALLLVTSSLFAVAPLLFERAADAGLREALATAAPGQRILDFGRIGRLPPGEDDPLAAVRSASAELRDAMPASVRELVAEPQVVVDSTGYLLLQAPRPVSRVRMRIQEDADQQIRYVAGRAPTAATTSAPVGSQVTPDGSPATATVFEASLSTATAEGLGVALGDRLMLAPDPGDEVIAAVGTSQLGYHGVDVVGLFEVIDPQAPAWGADTTLHTVVRERIAFEVYVYHGVALLATDAYAALQRPNRVEVPAFDPRQPDRILDVPLPLTYAWRFPVDPGRLDSGRIDELRRGLTRLESDHPALTPSFGSDEASLRTGLSAILGAYATQRATSSAVLAVAALGPASAALGALALVAVLQLRRRRQALLLTRGRGGSVAQLLGGQLIEALLLAVPAAALGWLLALLLVPARSVLAAAEAAALVAAVAMALLLAVALPTIRATRGEERPEASGSGGGRRTVIEVLVVVLALAGVASLRGRGLVPDEAGGVDPFLAAAPVLLGVAAGILLLRLYPIPVRALAWLLAHGRRLVPALALRTAARESAAGAAPMLVLLLATAMAVFSSVVLVTVSHGQAAASWQRVGGDYRVEAGSGGVIPPTLRPETIPGVEASAPAYLDAATYAGGTVRFQATRLAAIDVPATARVLDGTPVAPRFPPAFGRRAWQEGAAGTPDAPIPALISATLAARSGLGVGDRLSVTPPGGVVTATVEGVVRRFPGLPEAENLVIVPLDALRAAVDPDSTAATTLFVRGPASVRPLLVEAMARYGPRVTAEARADHVARITSAPLPTAVATGFALAVAVALAYSAIALGLALALALAARRRQHALLRALGLRRRDLVLLTVLEHGPMVALSLVAGVALGLATAWLLVPGLGLESLTGPGTDIVLRADALPIVLAAVVPIAVVATVVLAGAWLAGRADLARAVRLSEAT